MHPENSQPTPQKTDWPDTLYTNSDNMSSYTWLHTKEALKFAIKDLNEVSNNDGYDDLTWKDAVCDTYDFERVDKENPDIAYYSTTQVRQSSGRTRKWLEIIQVSGRVDGQDTWEQESFKNVEDDYEENSDVYAILEDHS